MLSMIKLEIFFSTTISNREGFFEDALGSQDYLYPITSSVSTADATVIPTIDHAGHRPASGTFSHPLNAEVHDIKIYNRILGKAKLEKLWSEGVSEDDIVKPTFYLPVYFTPRARARSMFTTPFTLDTTGQRHVEASGGLTVSNKS